jgi:hypothetical protein
MSGMLSPPGREHALHVLKKCLRVYAAKACHLYFTPDRQLNLEENPLAIKHIHHQPLNR